MTPSPMLRSITARRSFSSASACSERRADSSAATASSCWRSVSAAWRRSSSSRPTNTEYVRYAKYTGITARMALHSWPRTTTTAAAAPAVPTTVKLAALQRKSSRQILRSVCRVDKAIAAATRPVLRTKYVAVVPTSGLASPPKSEGVSCPPSDRYATPVAAIVTAAAATLNAVRYSGYGRLTLIVHCVQAPAIATRSAAPGPSNRSAVRFAPNETESVDPLESGIGRLTFHIDVRHDASTSAEKSPIGGHWRGAYHTAAHAPAIMTAMT